MLCPVCRKPLSPSGSIDVDGRAWSVYQCDVCTRPWTFGGETFPAALTFAVDENGNLLDPETLEPLNLN